MINKQEQQRAREKTMMCPACAGPSTRPYLSGHRDRMRVVARPFSFTRCDDCGLRFQNVGTDEAASLYADFEDIAEVTKKAARRALRAEDDVLDVIEGLCRERRLGRRLLDIGAGDGWLLAAARRRGFHAIGTDVSERLADVARLRSGADVLVGQLDKLRLPEGSFDIVNLDQVLMYVPSPRQFLAEVRRVLSPGGLVRVREYDAHSLSARWAGRRYWMYAPTRVQVWTRRAVREVATGAGLDVARVIAGTEARLKSWLAAERNLSPRAHAKAAAQFVARRFSVGDFAIGADTVFYLRRN
jgi:SAM-dependent methyltransferase